MTGSTTVAAERTQTLAAAVCCRVLARTHASAQRTCHELHPSTHRQQQLTAHANPGTTALTSSSTFSGEMHTLDTTEATFFLD